ncbi:MAG TPA: IS4 family transposase [Streptosporangiaceae bacterium]|nr:IS4 family transposase [Streptosporangiaceae bacterium]
MSGDQQAGPQVRPDQVTLGVLVGQVPRDVIDPVVAGLGKGARRSDGKLPAHVTAYLTMGLWLFPDDPYEEVATKVTGGLDRFGCWDASWSVPTASGITQARKRLGAQVMEQVFEGVAQPVATRATRGAWLRGRRLVAIDGFDVDLPDSDDNTAVFGHASGGQGVSGYPKARVVALAECGTHAFLAAEIGPYGVGEKTLARRLYPRLHADEILTADRNFYSFEDWGLASRAGAALLWRAPTGLDLPVVQVLEDGTYRTVLIKPTVRGARRRREILAAARDGADLDDPAAVPAAWDADGNQLAHLARVVEYDVPDRDGNGTGELIVLLTTILDPADAHADELAAAYHERWEQETGHDQLKTHLRGPAKILRSRLPDLVYQEICCAMRRSVISPAQRGEMGGISLDLMANPEPKGKIGDRSMPGN